MKITLINPPHVSGVYSAPPLGLAYIASMLIFEGHDVKIIDAPVMSYDFSNIKKKVKIHDPDVIGITAMTPTINSALMTANVLSSLQVPIIMGGPHPTVMANEILEKNENVDFVVRGEGELTMIELVETLKQNKFSEIKKIKGLTFRKNKKIIATPNRPFIEDLDKLPFPAFNLLPLKKYRQRVGRPSNFLTIITSRGCPFRCSFCSKSVFGKKYRFRSPENIFKEIIHLIDTYKIKEIVFYDDVFTLNRKRILDLCDLIIKNKIDIPWRCETRTDLVDEFLLMKIKKAGCYLIAYGVESGSSKLLKVIKKDITKQQIRKAFKITKKAGIETMGYFMVGIPGESEKTIKETLNFAIELEPDHVQFSLATPFPDTELFRMVEDKISKDWSKFVYFGDFSSKNYGSLYSEQLISQYKNLIKKFYFRPSYVIKRLLKLRSLDNIKRDFSNLKLFLNLAR